MLRYFEAVRGVEGGHSVNKYIENFARDFFTNLTLKERQQVIAAGENFPTSALSILAKLPRESGAGSVRRDAPSTSGSKAKKAKRSRGCASA